MDHKAQKIFKIPMSYKSGASYNSPGHIRRPSAHTQREANIWGESRYIYAVQIYKGRVQILSISHLAGRMQDAKSEVQCASSSTFSDADRYVASSHASNYANMKLN